MIILVCDGDTLGTYRNASVAAREARFAAHLFSRPVEMFDLRTKERTIWN